MRDIRRRSRWARLGLPVLAAALTCTTGALAASGNPPGANGTVKVDAAPFDTHPNNQPHVGCTFQIDFYGFDMGPYNARVIFEVHPPTGRALLLNDYPIFIGEDRAGGGTDLDAERTYNLSEALANYSPHPKQGYHVKLTVEAPGAGGKIAKKHKVFWVDKCADDEAPKHKQVKHKHQKRKAAATATTVRPY